MSMDENVILDRKIALEALRTHPETLHSQEVLYNAFRGASCALGTMMLAFGYGPGDRELISTHRAVITASKRLGIPEDVTTQVDYWNDHLGWTEKKIADRLEWAMKEEEGA